MLDAGITELAEHGLAGASMEAIARARAEVSKRTLYKHFPSKEAVLEAVLQLLMERVDPLSRLHYDDEREFRRATARHRRTRNAADLRCRFSPGSAAC